MHCAQDGGRCLRKNCGRPLSTPHFSAQGHHIPTDAKLTYRATLGLAKQDFFEMTYTVLFNDGEAAQVQGTGKVTGRLGSIDDVDQVIELRRLDGRWYIWSVEGGL